MPNSKVIQVDLAPDGSLAVIVELSHLEPGEKALVTTTVTQDDTALAEATALVTGAAPAGKQRINLVAAPNQGAAFRRGRPLAAYTQATTVWTTPLKQVAEAGNKIRWVPIDSGWPGQD